MVLDGDERDVSWVDPVFMSILIGQESEMRERNDKVLGQVRYAGRRPRNSTL